MIQRGYILEVQRKLSLFPVVVLLGPRQCGKTTLAQSLGGRYYGGRYYDMETEGSYARLDAEWHDAAMSNQLIVIDEAQEAPEVFKRLRGTIDADRQRKVRSR